jgi:hypothetical protein
MLIKGAVDGKVLPKIVMFKILGESVKLKLCCYRYTIKPLQNFESLKIESSIKITAPESVPRKSINSL